MEEQIDIKTTPQPLDPETAWDVAHEANTIIDQAEIPSGKRNLFAQAHGEQAVPRFEQINRLKHDEMTGMLDRYQLTEALNRTLAIFKKTIQETCQTDPDDIREFAVVMPDIDFFGWWNDALQAHLLGDLVLQEIGLFFERNLHKNDLKIRSGGEEFTLIILNPNGEAGACAAAERLVTNAKKHLLPSLVKNQLVISKNRAMAESTLLGSIEDSEGSAAALRKVDAANHAIRQAITGMISLHENKPIQIEKDGNSSIVQAQDYFLGEGNIKGDLKSKQKFLETINDFCSGITMPELGKTAVADFLADTRPYAQLTPEERHQRNAFEEQFAMRVIPALFGEITLSMGLVYVDRNFPEESLNPESLRDIADKRMFRAKMAGRNRYVILLRDQI